ASLVFRDTRLTEPSALELVNNNGSAEIFATNAGDGSLVVFLLSEGTTTLQTQSTFEARGSGLEALPLDEAGLFLAAAFLTNSAPAGELSADGGRGVAALLPAALPGVLGVGIIGGEDFINQDGAGRPGAGPEEQLRPIGPAGEASSPLTDFIGGAEDGLATI